MPDGQAPWVTAGVAIFKRFSIGQVCLASVGSISTRRQAGISSLPFSNDWPIYQTDQSFETSRKKTYLESSSIQRDRAKPAASYKKFYILVSESSASAVRAFGIDANETLMHDFDYAALFVDIDAADDSVWLSSIAFGTGLKEPAMAPRVGFMTRAAWDRVREGEYIWHDDTMCEVMSILRDEVQLRSYVNVTTGISTRDKRREFCAGRRARSRWMPNCFWSMNKNLIVEQSAA